MRQVITINDQGHISGLQVKPGRGFDLRQLGTASIKRASEIVWSETHQKWFVHIMSGKYTDTVVTTGFCHMVGYDVLNDPDTSYKSDLYVISTEENSEACSNLPFCIFFDNYEDAVTLEIAVLDHIRFKEGSSVL
jgi:hypothetical protein